MKLQYKINRKLITTNKYNVFSNEKKPRYKITLNALTI